VYQGKLALGAADTYAQLLHQAKTMGFSVYLAEQGMTAAKWTTFGKAITQLDIAAKPG
jgi:hypothetical protein